MNDVEIYIGDDLVDLPLSVTVAQTYKIFDVNNITAQFKHFSNTFTLPFTEKNDRIFGNARQIQSDTSVPYSLDDCRVVVNGIDIVENGMVVLKSSDSGYRIYVISGLTFFDKIGDKLSDLDFTATGNGLNGTYYGELFTATTGVVTPVLQYGRFDGTDLYDEAYLPSYYYHTIIDAIIDDAGYSKSGSVFSNAKYLKTIIPYSRSGWNYGGDFISKRELIVQAVGGQTTLGKIAFATIVYEGSEGWWNAGTNEVIPLESDASSGDIICNLEYELTLDITVVGGTIDVSISPGGNIFTNIGTGVHHTVIGTTGGEQARVNTAYHITTNINSGAPTITINVGTRLKVTPQNIPQISSTNPSYFYHNLLLPEMSQKEFLKDFILRFGAFPQEKNNVLYFKSLDDIVSDRANAVDWTLKRVRSNDKISYAPSNYGRRNYFKYRNNDLETPFDFGEAFFEIANESIKPEATISNQVFSATNTTYINGILCAKVTIYDGTQINLFEKFTFNPGIRILLIRDRYTGEPIPDSDGTPISSSYKVAYFDDPAQAYTCKWSQTLEDEYPLFIESLQKFKEVGREYNLTAADIANLDFHLPIFDEDSYFILNEVGPFVAGKVTEVTLLKI